MRTPEITNAIIKLMKNHGFFATILLNLKIVEDNSIPTACVSTTTMRVNAEWFKTLSLDHRLAVLAHECMHPALKHHTRMKHRDPRLWNYATDYVINPILVDAGMKLPEGVLLDQKYNGLTAEEVYTMLKRENPPEPEKGGGGKGDSTPQEALGGSQGDDQGNDGESSQNGDGAPMGGEWMPGDGFAGGLGDVEPFEGDTEEREAEEKRMDEIVMSASEVGRRQGTLPGGILRWVEEQKDPVIDWEDQLRQWMSERAYDDYSWRQPNRRYIHQGVYMPSMLSETYGEMALLLDTSCSLGQKDLDECAGEVNSIDLLVAAKKHVMYIDSKLQGYDVFEGHDAVDLHFKGGGGTDFRPGFSKIEEEGITPKVVIYFTDGYCSSYPEVPDYPVLWMITANGRKNFNPPFGDVIHM